MDYHAHYRTEGDQQLPSLAWRLDPHRLCIASAPLGGGIGERSWILNAQVRSGYDRDDPDAYLTELASTLGLAGPGVGLMTAVDVTTVSVAEDSGVVVWATVGVEVPALAAAPDQVVWRVPSVGTINIVVSVPARFSEAALVNAVATATEAKSQAMFDHGMVGTGTPTDAVCITCPTDGPAEAYGGPRSRLGAPLARAVHTAVAAGLSR